MTPLWLNEAKGQWSCKEEGRFCTVGCKGDNVNWFAHNCSPYDVCPPHGTVPVSDFYDVDPREKKASNPSPSPSPAPVPKKATNNAPAVVDTHIPSPYEMQFMEKLKESLDIPTRDILKKHGWNLRGLDCEILDGNERCYAQNKIGR